MSFTTVQKAFIALIVANIVWGGAAPVFKLSLQNIPPFTLAFWRFFLGALLLLAFLGKKTQIKLATRRDFFDLIAYAISGITINIIFFFWGLKLTYAINAPIIASGQPILTLIFAMIFLGEKFIWRKAAGMILGTLGLLIIILEPLLATGLDSSVVGNLFLVIAGVAAVSQTIIGKNVFKRFNPWSFTFWAFLIGAASFLPLAIYELNIFPNLYTDLDWRGYLGIIYGAVFSSALAYSFYAWGLSKISATDASMFYYIDPVVGTILAFLLLKEPITALFLIGSLLIFGGIFLAEGKIHYHPLHLLRAIRKGL